MSWKQGEIPSFFFSRASVRLDDFLVDIEKILFRELINGILKCIVFPICTLSNYEPNNIYQGNFNASIIRTLTTTS